MDDNHGFLSIRIGQQFYDLTIRVSVNKKKKFLHYKVNNIWYGPLDLRAGDGMIRATACIINDMLTRGWDDGTPPIGTREAGPVINLRQNSGTTHG